MIVLGHGLLEGDLLVHSGDERTIDGRLDIPNLVMRGDVEYAFRGCVLEICTFL